MQCLNRSLNWSILMRRYNSASTKPIKMFNTECVIGLAVRVFNENGKTVTKAPQFVTQYDPTGTFNEKPPKGARTGESNKEKVLALLKAGNKPTANEIKTSKELVERLKGHIMLNELKGQKANEFTGSIADLTSSIECPQFGIGTIVWLPKVVSDIASNEAKQEEIQSIGVTSEFFGKPKDKVALTITPIRSRFVGHIAKSNVTAMVDGNLVSFWFPTDMELNKPISITGRIKDHIVDTYLYNNKVTRINFVKKTK